MSDTIPSAQASAMRNFLLRLHLYAGLFIGPFLLIAALTGLLYVLTPQVEERLYADVLHTRSEGVPQSLAAQAEAARHHLGNTLDVSMLRPAPFPGDTTRVMFSDPSLGPSENRTVFVDPVTLEIKGDLTTYGTSGILPLRTSIDYFHRNLNLGEWGRYYSELAASWLWVVVIGGVVIWATAPGRRRALRDMPPVQRRRWLHGMLGVISGLVLLFLSITGLTWSQAAGGRIDGLRNVLGWNTPGISIVLPDDDHANHHDHDAHGEHAVDTAAREDRLTELDQAWAASREAGIDSPYAEIRLPKPGMAWSVREYDRSWPTQVDAVAMHPQTLAVTSRADFADFGLVARLVRWGVDAHMGILFGLPNQILMALTCLALLVTIFWGYRIWWQRRPRHVAPLYESWKVMSWKAKASSVLIAVGLGWVLPAMGISLLAFVAFDLARTLCRRSSGQTF